MPRDPLQTVKQAVAAHDRAQEDEDRARTALYEAIRAAHAAGIKQVDLVEATGYTREYIRRIVRDGK